MVGRDDKIRRPETISLAEDRLRAGVRKTDAAWLNSIAADHIHKRRLGLRGFRLPQYVEDVVSPDRLPVSRTDIHSHQDIPFLDGGLRFVPTTVPPHKPPHNTTDPNSAPA